MASINIDIDLDEFDTSDIIREIEYRIDEEARKIKKSGNKNIVADAELEIAEIREAAVDFIEMIDRKHRIVIEGVNNPTGGRNLYDQLKIDHFFEVMADYTIEQIEQLIPKK